MNTRWISGAGPAQGVLAGVAAAAILTGAGIGVYGSGGQEPEPESQAQEGPEEAPATRREPSPILPVIWLLWPSGECLHVSRNGSCDEPPPVAEVGWAAPQFEGPPWFRDGTPLGTFDIEFEPQRLQRRDPDGRAAF